MRRYAKALPANSEGFAPVPAHTKLHTTVKQGSGPGPTADRAFRLSARFGLFASRGSGQRIDHEHPIVGRFAHAAISLCSQESIKFRHRARLFYANDPRLEAGKIEGLQDFKVDRLGVDRQKVRRDAVEVPLDDFVYRNEFHFGPPYDR